MQTLSETLTKVARRTAMIEAAARIRTNITGMRVAAMFRDMTGEDMDWHEASEYLDKLRNDEFLKATGHNASGMTEYAINF